MNGVKGIGFRLEDGSIYDGNFDLMVMGEMQTKFINEIPQYRYSPLVQKAIADMEDILSKQKERDVTEPEREPEPRQHPAPEENRGQSVRTDRNMASDRTVQKSMEGAAQSEKKSQESEKTAENAPKMGRELSGGGQETICPQCAPGTAGKDESTGERKTGAGENGTEERRAGIIMVRFEENEYFLTAMFQEESRQATIEGIHKAIPYIGRDEEMLTLINSTLEKLWFLSDEEFLSMDLEPYRQEPVEDE